MTITSLIERRGIEGIMINNLTVLVGTCDDYSPLWANFKKCFNKYFPYDVNLLFVGETKKVPGHATYLPGKLEWGSRVRNSLSLVKDDYVFFLLEDYFLSFDYGLDRINSYIKDMEEYSMNRLQISKSDFQTYIPQEKYWKFANNSSYSFSMQPSIWRKDWIHDNCPDNFSPWNFECVNSDKYMGRDTKTYLDRSIDFYVYFNAVRRGFKKSDGWESFRQREALEDFVGN